MTLTNYWWLLIWLFLGGGFLVLAFPKRNEVVLGKVEKRWNVFPAIILIVPYIIWAGFRSDIYGDTYAYRQSFFKAPSQLGELGAYLVGVSKDKGFSVLTVFIKWIAGNSDIVYFLIIAAVQLICLALIYRKYSCDYWTSIFLFVASTDYLSWCHNGIRQFMAIILILAATELLLKKKYFLLIVVILIASTFHASALLMIPIVFIVQGKAWNKKTVLCIIASVIALSFVEQFTNVLDTLVSNTQYSNIVTDWKEWQDDGTNPIRVFIYSIPMILSIVGFKQIKNKDDSFVNILTNFSILTSAIALISMVTSGIFLGRLIIYPAIYSSFLLLPWEIDNLFTKDSAQLIKIAMIVGYIGFFFYQMHFSWGLI